MMQECADHLDKLKRSAVKLTDENVFERVPLA
ncbi:hypothetical protein TMEC54S_03079 [Thauera mechernichensis]